MKGCGCTGVERRGLYFFGRQYAVKSGSYEISERAGETLSKIAKIIMDYKEYEVLIEGNTDTDPISRPNIRNNWDLSTLRASSGGSGFAKIHTGVDPKAFDAAGRGEYNPVASNDTPEGKMRNRRTQIIITPKFGTSSWELIGSGTGVNGTCG